MEKQERFTIDKEGHLFFGGADCVQLAEQYGTPLFVYDEEAIRAMMRVYRDTLLEEYAGNGAVLYSVKAFPCMALCSMAKQEGLGLEVSSGGELYTAIKAGVSAKTISFVGNNKSKDEIAYALDCGVGCVVVDAYTEIETIDDMAKKRGIVQDIMLRINPVPDSVTSSLSSDSKFGFSVADGTAKMMTAFALGKDNVSLIGYHYHIGSQIKNRKAFLSAAEVCMKFIAEMKYKNDFETEYLNLGGGFPIWYTDEDERITPDGYRERIRELLQVVKDKCAAYRINGPYLMLEPGRSLVGEAGITLYRVGSIKNIPGVRKYVCVDGGMTDNPRYALYGAKYDALLANRANEKNTEVVTLAGKSSDNADVIACNVSLPKAETGDILAVFSTGAYHYSMATNYGRTPLPAAVLVKEGKAEIIVKRQSYEDVVRCDVLPDSLK